MNGNQVIPDEPLNRASEVEHLIDAVKALIVPFVRAADEAAPARATGRLPADEQGVRRNVLVEPKRPEVLARRLAFSLPGGEGRGEEGLLQTIQNVLEHSVNTWDQGFLDKLYASTNAVGVVSEMLLSVLNTNLHVYQVSPALTVIEKQTAKTLANLFGFTGPRAGGISCQGGSASNLTSLAIARNALYPECKTDGGSSRSFVLFTSAHGHYSVEKAAVTCGLGSSAVWTVPVDGGGRMSAAALRELVARARGQGKTPLYVNATAGTTVLGSYDPLAEIAAVCREFGLWMHVDASWGGPAVFSRAHRHKLAGAELADSLTVNPHKMMNVPVTCSFLLTGDLSVFHKANTLPAGYLFHGPADDDNDGDREEGVNGTETATQCGQEPWSGEEQEEVWDLADLTLQCGRRGDSLKLALSWIYYGATGFERQVDRAFETAAHLATLVQENANFTLVSSNPPPCLQVCFYYQLVEGAAEMENTRRTRTMVGKLLGRGYMVDYAPGHDGRGSFFRVVVNCQTLRGTVEGLVKAVEEVGREVVGA